VVKYPKPPILLADPQAGFIGTQGGAGQELGSDPTRLRGEGSRAAASMATSAPLMVSLVEPR